MKHGKITSVRTGRRARRVPAAGSAGVAGSRKGARRNHRHRPAARGKDRGRAGHDHGLHATDIKSAGIERPQDFIALTPGVSQVQTAEAGDLQVNIRGINTGRDAETNFALVVDGVLQTNPNALNQELVGHHADRNPQGSARRAVRPQCRGRRTDHDDAQARRRVGDAKSPQATAATTPTRAASTWAGRSPTASRARSRRTPATPTASGRTSRTTATTASTSSRKRACPAGCCSTSAAATWTSRPSIPRSIPARSISMPRSPWSTRRRSSVRLRSTKTRTSTISATSTTSIRRTSRRTSTSRSRATGMSASRR